MDSDNIERYDRQIRLWGHHGQNKCHNSKICLINANSLGTEILKGLCLAGIGSFTILDSHKLAPEDVGCLFIPHSSIGKGRGEAAKLMLLDLNEKVSGEVFPLETYLPHVDEDFTDDLAFWKQFNCIVASGFLYIDQIQRLSKICWTTNIPLILCKSIGFYGTMRSQIKEHIIIETHPDWRPANINPEKLPETVQNIFNNDKNKDTTFWLIIKAIKIFIQQKKRLPSSGTSFNVSTITDEDARLQNEKAKEDIDCVFGIVQNLANSSPNYSPGFSLYDETKLICKNLRDLILISTDPIHQDYDSRAYNINDEESEDDFITISIGLKALDLFYSSYGRLPGSQNDQIETDITKLKSRVKHIIGKTSNQLKTLDQCLYELCRCGGAELHATSAFLGGCIAQEVIKLITNQYVPVDDTLVYNAMSATTRSFKFSDVFAKA